MKKTLNTLFFSCFSFVFLILLLFCSKDCISLSTNGLLIWYRNMIPSLFPFMVLSGFMVRTGLSIKIGQLLHPILSFLFPLPSQMLYVIFMGFLCGFPMGAKIITDMLDKEQLSLKEGEYLLAFCNNIGPLYMLGYVIPLFNYNNIWQILGYMYLIPFSYGILLRYFYAKSFTKQAVMACSYKKTIPIRTNYISCFQHSLSSAIEQITMLGGCMIFFNCLLIFPKQLNMFLSNIVPASSLTFLISIISSVFEIGGGLQQLSSVATNSVSDTHFFLPLSLLTFGGFSCIMQTCFILKNTGLKIHTYVMHKLLQSCIFIILMLISC